MAALDPAIRLKVTRDTFYLPDEGGVYFRNNQGFFRMEGKTIQQWIEQLLPAFDGQHTLADLTEGLPKQYRDRVYEIAEVLHRNGFLRDVSQERSHQLPNHVLSNFGDQITFLESLTDSAAFRFQSYREAKVLAIGAGHFLVTLVAALFSSGLPTVHMLITDAGATNRARLAGLVENARDADPTAALHEVGVRPSGEQDWRDVTQGFDAVVYVSDTKEYEELRCLDNACRQAGTLLMPAVYVGQVGMAGPLTRPKGTRGWESAWRRVHQSAVSRDPNVHAASSTAEAVLANVIVFEVFKALTGVLVSEEKDQIFLLNLETLEGTWHSFLPHLMAGGCRTPEWLQEQELQSKEGAERDESQLLEFFGELTSSVSGIFEVWEEGELRQLPLAQCRVQVVDPLSAGPAALLPGTIHCGLTHVEARREAGLSGIEQYVSRMVGRLVSLLPPHPEYTDLTLNPLPYIGVGAGECVAEGVVRGLQKCLMEDLRNQLTMVPPIASTVTLGEVADEHCAFYLQALTRLQGPPICAIGAPTLGFPVLWVKTKGEWFGGVGLNVTLALRFALLQALQKCMGQTHTSSIQVWDRVMAISENGERPLLAIPTFDDQNLADTLESSLGVLRQHGKRLYAIDLSVEAFLRDRLEGVFGVLLRAEGSP